jgi:hypothetical protein
MGAGERSAHSGDERAVSHRWLFCGLPLRQSICGDVGPDCERRFCISVFRKGDSRGRLRFFPESRGAVLPTVLRRA